MSSRFALTVRTFVNVSANDFSKALKNLNMSKNKSIVIEMHRVRRDAQIGVRVASPVKVALEQIAADQGMSLSDFVNVLVIREIERQGFDVTLKGKLA